MEHDCTRSGEFEKLEIVYKEVMGNGEKGLAKYMIVVKEIISELKPEIKSLRTVISGIEKTIVVIQTIARENERHNTNRKWYIGTMITVGGIAITAIIAYITT